MNTPVLLELLERHQYRAAYERLGTEWKVDPSVLHDPAEAVAMGRLAFRVGAPDRGQRYLNRAKELEPEADEVLVWAGGPPAHPDPVAWIHHLETTRLPVEPQFIRSQAGSRIGFYTELRLFDRAEAEFLAHGGEESSDDWILHSGAVLRYGQNRWNEAWELALTAWNRRPGYPPTAELLVRLGPRLGNPEGWPGMLWEGDSEAQSYQLELCRFHAAAFQVETGAPLRDWRSLANKAALDARISAPEAEPAVLSIFDRIDEEQRLLAPLETKVPRVVRWFQGYNQCVPASLATALSAWGGTVSAAEWAREMTWGGTQTLDALRALRRRGWWARVLSLAAGDAEKLLDEGIPFVVSARGEFFGHSLTALGRDARGKFLLHDPEGFRLVTWEFPTTGDPTEALVVLPQERADLQSRVPTGDSREVEAYLELLEALEDGCPSWDWQGLGGEWESRARTQWLLAAGRDQEALERVREWAERTPDSLEARKLLIHILSLSSNRRAYRRELRCRDDESSTLALAEELSRSALDRDEARHLFAWSAVQSPKSPRIYLGLARWALTHGDLPTALTASEIGCALDPHSEAAALLRAQVLVRADRRSEALAFLEARTLDLGSGFKGAAVFRTWIEFLGSDSGDILLRALSLHPADPKLLELAADASGGRETLEEAASSLEAAGGKGGAARLRALAALATPGADPTSRLLDWTVRRPWDQAAWVWLRRLFPAWTPEFPPPTWTAFLYQEASGDPDPSRAAGLWGPLIEADPWSAWLWRDEAFRRLTLSRRQGLTETSRQRFETSVREAVLLEPEAISAKALLWEQAWFRGLPAETAAGGLAALWFQDPAYTYGAFRCLDLLESVPRDIRRDLLTRLELQIRGGEGPGGLADRLLEEWGRWVGSLEAGDLAMAWVHGPSELLSRAGLGFLRWSKVHGGGERWPDLVQSVSPQKPQTLDWDRYRIEAALAAKHPGGARTIAQGRLEAHPRDGALRRQCIRSWWQEGRWAEGWTLWEEGLALPLPDPEEWTELAGLALSSRQGPRALKAWHRAPSTVTKSLRALLTKARWEENLNRRGDAEATLRQAAAEYPTAPVPLGNLARLLDDDASDPAPLIEVLQAAQRLDASHWDSVDQLAVHQKRISEEYLDPRRECLTAARGRGAWLLYQEGEKDAAQQALKAVLAEMPGYEWGWRLLIFWAGGDLGPLWLQALDSPLLFQILWEEHPKEKVPVEILDAMDSQMESRPGWRFLAGPSWLDLIQVRRGPGAEEEVLKRWGAVDSAADGYIQLRAVLRGEGEADQAWARWEGVAEEVRAPWEYRLLAEIAKTDAPGMLVEPLVRRIVARQISWKTALRLIEVLGEKGDGIFAPWPEHDRILGWSGGPSWPCRLLESFVQSASEPRTHEDAAAIGAILERVEDLAPFPWLDSFQAQLTGWTTYDAVWIRRGYHLSRKNQWLPRHWWTMRRWESRPGAEFWSVTNLLSALSWRGSKPWKPPRWVADPLDLGLRLMETLSPDRLIRWALSVTIDEALRRGRVSQAQTLALRYQKIWDRTPETANHYWPQQWDPSRTQAFEALVKAMADGTSDPLAIDFQNPSGIPFWLFRSERALGLVSSLRLRSLGYWMGRGSLRCRNWISTVSSKLPIAAALLGLAGVTAVFLGGLVDQTSGTKGLGVVLIVAAVAVFRRRGA